MKQLELALKTWGGRRKGAGRKPVGVRAGVSHRVRARVTRHTPVHVTLRVRAGVGNLRRPKVVRALLVALGCGAGGTGFRLTQYSIQSNHLHLIVEADGNAALARGMQGLCIRLARTVNRVRHGEGRVFADRYHSHVLTSPREVRHALVYVINNARKHEAIGVTALLDPYASGACFDGWRAGTVPRPAEGLQVTRRPRCWLLTVGWRRCGLLVPSEVPTARVVARRSRTA